MPARPAAPPSTAAATTVPLIRALSCSLRAQSHQRALGRKFGFASVLQLAASRAADEFVVALRHFLKKQAFVNRA